MLQVILMTPQPGSNPLTSLLPILLIGVVFYFFMIRPQTKKMKDQKKFILEVKKGDKVVTTSGIHGKISEMADTYIVLEVDTNCHIKMDRSAISMEATKAANNA